MVFPDATQPAATSLAPRVDVWFVTPPCQAYSRRNHARTDESAVEAVTDFDRMLEYARMRRPWSVVVENVDEPSAVTAITAAVLSVQGYAWVVIESEAGAYGSMARARRFWVGSCA